MASETDMRMDEIERLKSKVYSLERRVEMLTLNRDACLKVIGDGKSPVSGMYIRDILVREEL